ncbi:ion transporter [Hymenobacter glacialis]|uniref:Ion transporter n=1 Tax=Hymenobacter glacialis TaxID=1908236 RepID=A0A1G1TCD1_9BACT|nr:ion transporter [Hymenobacter glacialis]OGX88539.1 ion transporter [Hymenobacter glacialis]
MDSRLRDTTPGWKERAYIIIFESDTHAGRLYDIVLLTVIVLSVATVMLDSVSTINAAYGAFLRVLEWFFTLLFTLEYLARLVVTRRKLAYAFSWLGIIDFLSTGPALAALVFSGGHYLLAIRTLRLLRMFRIFKLGKFVGEGEFIVDALKASRFKIMVFLTAVLTLTIVMGTLMYAIEGGEHGFTSIPKSVYWAIVTVTTVGYGDISPVTILGQTLASLLMVMGYGIIAVPTGIVSAQMAMPTRAAAAAAAAAIPTYKMAACQGCQATNHRPDAAFCWRCGQPL